MSQPGANKERGYLLVLWVLTWGVVAWLWPEPPAWARIAAWVGTAALVVLVARLFLAGFSGYERRVGLRIVLRDRSSPRARFWLLVCAATWAVSLGLLSASHYLWADAAWLEDPALRPTIDVARLALVGIVTASTFFGLLLLIAQRFSVFGTTSVIGVVLGVAALMVVQSVATGFQHEFERRVLGVYAHINVTRPAGISEYRRFEAWLRTLPGVEGASPFVYYSMGLAPDDPTHEQKDDILFATVLVKGIEPATADQVIDVVEHLEAGSREPVPLDRLRSDFQLRPVPDRADEDLPPVIAATPDPRGADWYEKAIEDYHAAGTPRRRIEGFAEPDEDEWIDPPGLGPDGDAEPADAPGLVDENLPTLFVGVTLAEELHLEIGEVVRLVDPGATFDHGDEPQWGHYEIAGIFQAGFQEYDSRLVYVDIKELERFKYRGADTVSGVDLRLSDPARAPEVGAMIREGLADDDYKVLEWQKLNENLFSSIRAQKNVITVVLSLVIFVASFNVLSALWTMVVRRTAEISIVMSMGATGPQIARIFQVTGMTIGLAGALAGVGFGLMMCWLVELYGYTLDPDVYFIESLPVEIDPVQIAWILGLALAICYVATIPPSLRAAWLRPVEGLRYE